MLPRRAYPTRTPGALLTTILAILLISSLVACSAGSQTTSPAPSAQPSTSAKAPETSKPAESKPAASASVSASPSTAPAAPLKIGALLTTSGPVGEAGTRQMVGLEMAIEEINASGGIMGRKIELIQRDDGGDPTKALAAAHELVEKQGVTLILGTTVSSTALAVLPYLTEQKVVLIGSHSAAAAVDAQKYPYGFTGSPTSSLQAAIIVKYAVDIVKAQKIGILAESSAYGNGTLADLKAQLEAQRVQPTAVEQYPQGTLDMTTALSSLRKAGVQVILGATLGADSVRILKNLQSMNWEVPYLGNSDLATTAVVQGVGPEGLKLTYAYNFKRLAFSDKLPVLEKGKQFVAKVAKKMNQSPLKESVQQQALFYDLTYLIKAAVEAARSTEGAKVAAALDSIKDFDGVEASYTFTKEKHSGLDLDDLVMVKPASLRDGVFEMAPGY